MSAPTAEWITLRHFKQHYLDVPNLRDLALKGAFGPIRRPPDSPRTILVHRETALARFAAWEETTEQRRRREDVVISRSFAASGRAHRDGDPLG